MSVKLTRSNYNEIVKNSSKPILIDFYADWCGPCKMAGPIIEQMSQEMKDKAVICKVNIDQEREIANSFGITSIPTFVVIKDNKVTNKVTGLRSRQELTNMIAF